MWCAKYFMIELSAASLAPGVFLKSKKNWNKLEGMLPSLDGVMYHPLETYTTEDVITVSDMEIQIFKVPSKMTLNDYSEVLWMKELRWNQMCTKYIIKGIFLEVLSNSVRSCVRSYWRSNKSLTLKDLAWHSTLLWALRQETPHLHSGCTNTKRGSRQDRCRNIGFSEVDSVTNSPGSIRSSWNSLQQNSSNNVHVV